MALLLHAHQTIVLAMIKGQLLSLCNVSIIMFLWFLSSFLYKCAEVRNLKMIYNLYHREVSLYAFYLLPLYPYMKLHKNGGIAVKTESDLTYILTF